MDATFSAADIVDKTLTARTAVKVYYDATDKAVAFGSVAAGEPVGVVYSWLDPAPSQGRSGLWWMFRNSTGVFYYAPHASSNFDISELKKQGVITIAEKVKDADLAALPWYEQLIKKYGIWLIAVPVVGVIAPPLINNLFKNRG